MKAQRVEVFLTPSKPDHELTRELLRHNRPYLHRRGNDIVEIFRKEYAPHRDSGRLDSSFGYEVHEEGDEIVLRAGLINEDSSEDTMGFKAVQNYILPLEYGSRGIAQIYGLDAYYGKTVRSRIDAWARNRELPASWVRESIRTRGTRPADKWPNIVMEIKNLLSKRGFE